LEVSRRFEGTCRFHLQCRRISQAANQPKEGGEQSNRFAEIAYDKTLCNRRCENLKSYICNASHLPMKCLFSYDEYITYYFSHMMLRNLPLLQIQNEKAKQSFAKRDKEKD
jgi:hypothetical protein